MFVVTCPCFRGAELREVRFYEGEEVVEHEGDLGIVEVMPGSGYGEAVGGGVMFVEKVLEGEEFVGGGEGGEGLTADIVGDGGVDAAFDFLGHPAQRVVG